VGRWSEVTLADWLSESAEVSRTINGTYMIVVTAISLGVLYMAWRTKDRNAMRLYVLSIPIWLFIEGYGLVVGLREYTDQWPLVYFVVAVMEDPGWVTLGYMVAWRLFERRFPELAARRAQEEGKVSPPPSSSS
jgi:peptidoglycan/LPS O-acetylase OafA/YrhL